MNALVLQPIEKTARVQNVPIPKPASNELLVKVHYIALNPVDSLYTAHPLGQPGRVVGSDFAGTVVERGPDVPRFQADTINIGSRVAGFLQGACSVNDRPGAFAEFCVIPWDLVWIVPEEMDLKEAAGISLCALTAAQALFGRLGLIAPWRDVDSQENSSGERSTLKVLIYGASTSVALYAAQLIHRSAKVSQRKIELYGIASAAHHDFLRQAPYNYTALTDYSSSTWPSNISSLAQTPRFDLAFDCISEGSSVIQTSSVLTTTSKLAVVRSREGGAFTYSPDQFPTEPLYGAVWTGLGEKVQYQGMVLDASRDERQFSVEFYGYLSKDPLRGNVVRLMPGGLERVIGDGFALLGGGGMSDREGKREEEYMKPVRREKLVYEVGRD